MLRGGVGDPKVVAEIEEELLLWWLGCDGSETNGLTWFERVRIVVWDVAYCGDESQ